MGYFSYIVCGVMFSSYAWTKYQKIVWFSEAHRLYMTAFNELKSLEFDELLSRIGKPHDEERHLIRGHQFLTGWRVDEPGTVGAFVNDSAPLKVASKPVSEIDELEVVGYVDFVYPIPFIKSVHSGFSFNFFKKRDGELRVVYPRLDGYEQESGKSAA